MMERTGKDGQEGGQLNIMNVKGMFECRVFCRKVTVHLSVQQKAGAQRRSGNYPVVAEAVNLLESLYLSLAQIDFDAVEKRVQIRMQTRRGQRPCLIDYI
jgi:hypothetical protein